METLSQDYYKPVSELNDKELYFTTKFIPTLDMIDNQNMGKMRVMTQELVTTVFSDGWTTVDHHPILIVNVIKTKVAPAIIFGEKKRP